MLRAEDIATPTPSESAVEFLRKATALMREGGVAAAIDSVGEFAETSQLHRDQHLYHLGIALARPETEVEARAVAGAISRGSPHLRGRVMLELVRAYGLRGDHAHAHSIAIEAGKTWPSAGARAHALIARNLLEQKPPADEEVVKGALRRLGAAVRSAPYFGANEEKGRLGPDVADVVWHLREIGDSDGLRSVASGYGGWSYVEDMAEELELAGVHARLQEDLARGDVAGAIHRLSTVTGGKARDSLLGELGRWAVLHNDRETALSAAGELTPSAMDRAHHELAIAWLPVAESPSPGDHLTEAATAADRIKGERWRFEPLLELTVRRLASRDDIGARRDAGRLLRALKLFVREVYKIFDYPPCEKAVAMVVARCDMVGDAIKAIQSLEPSERGPFLLALLDQLESANSND